MCLDIVTSRLTASFRLFVRVEPLATVSDLFQQGFSSLVHLCVCTDPVRLFLVRHLWKVPRHILNSYNQFCFFSIAHLLRVSSLCPGLLQPQCFSSLQSLVMATSTSSLGASRSTFSAFSSSFLSYMYRLHQWTHVTHAHWLRRHLFVRFEENILVYILCFFPTSTLAASSA